MKKSDKINVDPWAAAGVSAVVFFNIVTLLELITGFQLFTANITIIGVIMFIIGISVHAAMDRFFHYDKEEDNLDSLFTLIFIAGWILWGIMLSRIVGVL